MKCLKYLLCILILAGGICVAPTGCGSGEATKIEGDFPAGPNDGNEGVDEGEQEGDESLEDA